MAIDWGLVINLASALGSFVLSVVAIWLSVYFYTEAKKTEAAVGSALAEIKSQTSSLERIAGRQLDRLTKAVVAQPQLGAAVVTEELRVAIGQIPDAVFGRERELTTAIARADACAEELRTTVIAVNYYAALANTFLQNWLPDDARVDDPFAELLNLTAGDYWYTDQLLAGIDPNLLKQARTFRLYTYATEIWKKDVRNAAQTLADRRPATSVG